MGFLSSIFTGNSPGLTTATNNLGSLAGYTGNTGQTATNAATGFDLGLLSGDPSKIAQTLAPEISTAQQQAQQNKNTVSQFGNRSGGMSAVMAGLDDATRSKIINLIGGLQQGAAGQLGQLGTQNLGLSTQQNMGAGQLSELQLKNFMDSILGNTIGGGIGGYLGHIIGA